MTTPKIATRVIPPTVAPLGLNRALAHYCRLAGLDSVLLNDHFQAFIPTAIWDRDFSWLATPGSSFHTFFDYQTLLGQAKTPKIWIAAHGPRMLPQTGQYGDGWLPHLVASPEGYAEKLDAIRTAARQAGRDPQAITVALD